MKNSLKTSLIIANFTCLAATLPIMAQSVPGLDLGAASQNQLGLSPLQNPSANAAQPYSNAYQPGMPNNYGNNANNIQFPQGGQNTYGSQNGYGTQPVMPNSPVMQYGNNNQGQMVNTNPYGSNSPGQMVNTNPYGNTSSMPQSPISPYANQYGSSANSTNFQPNNSQAYQQGQAVQNQINQNSNGVANGAPGSYLDSKLDSVESGFDNSNNSKNLNAQNNSQSGKSGNGHPALASLGRGLGYTALRLAPYAGMYMMMRGSNGMGMSPLMYPMMYGGYGYGGYGGMGSFGGFY